MDATITVLIKNQNEFTEYKRTAFKGSINITENILKLNFLYKVLNRDKGT